jgi:hypothetical protein
LKPNAQSASRVATYCSKTAQFHGNQAGTLLGVSLPGNIQFTKENTIETHQPNEQVEIKNCINQANYEEHKSEFDLAREMSKTLI